MTRITLSSRIPTAKERPSRHCMLLHILAIEASWFLNALHSSALWLLWLFKDNQIGSVVPSNVPEDSRVEESRVSIFRRMPRSIVLALPARVLQVRNTARSNVSIWKTGPRIIFVPFDQGTAFWLQAPASPADEQLGERWEVNRALHLPFVTLS